ncbi:hypothetical protein Tco_0754651, partial [Tanacetum coccineum]
LDNSLLIIQKPLKNESVPEKPNELDAPNRTINICSTNPRLSAIQKLVADSVAAALEAQAATMGNISNTNRNTGQSGTPFYVQLWCQIPRNLWKSSLGDYPGDKGNVTASKPQTLEEAVTIT